MSLFLGVVGSLIAWWIVTRWPNPRLSIGPILVDRPPWRNGQTRYRFHVKNRMRYRHANEVVIDVVLALQPEGRKGFWHVPVSVGHVHPTISPRKSFTATLQLDKINTDARVFQLLNDADLASSLHDERARLEALLYAAKEAFIRVAVTASHETSGNRRSFVRRFQRFELDHVS